MAVRMKQSMTVEKVSIIVPVYNGEKYIKRCLQSLIDQTYENTEIIVIDDGSTDASGTICDEYTLKYPNFKVFHVQNSGVSAARNKGIKHADGTYITFVDADDCLEKNMIFKLVALLIETKSDIAGCGFYQYPGEIPETSKQEKIEELTGNEFIEKGILSSDTRCWSKLYTKEIISGEHFDVKFTIGEDMLFLLALALKGAKFSRTDYQGYGYFINDSGAMNRGFKDSYMDQITCWQQAAEQITEKMPHLQSKVTSVLMVSIMLVVGKLAMLDRGQRIENQRYLSDSLKHLKACRRVKGAFRGLSTGYKIKVTVYQLCPGLYVWGYHVMKGK